jgi:hypothetical protein
MDTNTKTSTKTTTNKAKPKPIVSKSRTVTPKVKVETVPDLPSNPFIFEILNVVSDLKNNSKKVEALQKFSTPSLKTIFIWNFDETVISLLPEGDVPYAGVDEQNSFSGTLSEKINDAVNKMDEIQSRSLGSQDQGKSSIRKEYTKFYNFVKGGNEGLSSLRRETMFINILQGLHPLEAEILCLCKDKKLQTKYNITKELVSEAYPDIQWGGRS